MATNGIPRGWKFIGEIKEVGNLYRTGENSWRVVSVLYGKRVADAFNGKTFTRESFKTTFEYLGIADFGYATVKQWRLRPQAAIDELQAMAQAQGEYA